MTGHRLVPRWGAIWGDYQSNIHRHTGDIAKVCTEDLPLQAVNKHGFVMSIATSDGFDGPQTMPTASWTLSKLLNLHLETTLNPHAAMSPQTLNGRSVC